MISGDKALYLIEILEVLENPILEDSVELMLYTCQHCCLFEGVDAKTFESGFPVQVL